MSIKICPFVQSPFTDCYCVCMNSRKVESAIFYCGGNFEECRIFVESKEQCKANSNY